MSPTDFTVSVYTLKVDFSCAFVCYESSRRFLKSNDELTQILISLSTGDPLEAADIIAVWQEHLS